MLKYLLIILIMLISVSVFSQDKKVFEKQVTDLLKDFPNKYKNLRSKDSFTLKFGISGTADEEPFIMDGTNGVYTSSSLGFLDKKEDAKSWFDDWVTMISSLTPNGFKLKAEDCPTGGQMNVTFCKKWKLDNSKNNVPIKYQAFGIHVTYTYTGTSYLGYLYIGDVE